MQKIRGIELNKQNGEEVLPGFSEKFPYIATCAQLDDYIDPYIPWHWHRQIELFYMESGSLEYTTPHGTWLFTEGMGGMVNSNVLHQSRPGDSKNPNIQLLHIFDPSLLAGKQGSQIEERYMLPLLTDRKTEMIALHPEDPAEGEILKMVKEAFLISDQEWGYEVKLREKLTQIWLRLVQMIRPEKEKEEMQPSEDEKVKRLMLYIHEHYRESISVEQMAESVYISKRGCFRVFREQLHMTPVEYIHSYRLQRVCQMLMDSDRSITEIAQECGFGSSSYLGRLFHDKMGCTPAQYRRKTAQKEHKDMKE